MNQDFTPGKDQPQGILLKLVGFYLGEEEYAVDILRIKEIKLMQEITNVPKAPSFVEGVINLRGDIVPIIDLKKKLSLGSAVINEETKIIVVEIENKMVGMIVDEVSEVIEIEDTNMAPPPPIIAGIEGEYLKGVGRLKDKLLILLDITKILTTEEKLQLQHT